MFEVSHLISNVIQLLAIVISNEPCSAKLFVTYCLSARDTLSFHVVKTLFSNFITFYGLQFQFGLSNLDDCYYTF